MVKRLTICFKYIRALLLLVVFAMLSLMIWLHEGERSLAFAKPWIVSMMNSPTAPYTVAFGDITMHWGDVTELGQLRISKIDVSKREGSVFAQLPEMFVTIDPLGFLPDRRLFHKMILHAPRLFMSRNAAGTVQFGLEGSTSPMPMTELFTSITTDTPTGKTQSSALPFSEFVIDRATLNFSDAASETRVISTPFSMRLTRHHGRYDAVLAMPFNYEDDDGRFDATLRTLRDSGDHVLDIKLTKVPSKMLCVFGLCPDDIDVTGRVEGDIGLRIAEDGTPLGVRVDLNTKHAVLEAPKLFEKPIVLASSTLKAESDGATKTIKLTGLNFALEDTNISGAGAFHHTENGWYVDLEGKTGKLDMTALHKYWPLVMAPDSRLWVTSKIKSGRAENGVLRLNLTPDDFAAVNYSDKAVDATVDARDIRFEYLPGFPEVEHMNGAVHFTGGTVKIEGGGGSILGGTQISKAVLWCPDLNNPKIPMEASVTLSAPASDAATFLALPYFPFDDAAKLNPKTITGSVDATMKLKFDSFSGKKETDPNAIHLEAVDYSINATLKNVAQTELFGSYNAHDVNGSLKADNAQMKFDGSVALAEAGVADITLLQPTGKPLVATVKSRPALPGKVAAANDFSLSYESSVEAPKIKLTGQRLDMSQSYGSSGGGSLLKNFPAMHLEVSLAELLMAQGAPFTKVAGVLHCSAARCESADFNATLGKGQVKASIAHNKGMRELTMTASNAGQFLRALDISDRVVDGKFQLKGDYNDSQNPAPLKARLLIDEFTLKNSQILGRILSVGSLTGLMNVLTGEGIAFDKMAADVVARAGVFNVSKGKASGNAMGMTVEGLIDSNSTKLKLKGVVVPAYAINSILGKIPIIGALAGGEGEGLIAFNYSIDGNFEKPDVSVNPLSGLTPGFLRGIFGIFDSDDAADQHETSAQTAPAAADEQKKTDSSDASPDGR